MFNVSALLLDDILLKSVVTEVVLFSVVDFKTLKFHKVAWWHTWDVVGYLLLQIFPDSDSEKKFEKWSVFDDVI